MDKTNKILISISLGIVVIIVLLVVLSLNKKPSKYTITFDSNGGTIVLDQSVKNKEKVLKPADPTKKGYMFIEWQYNDKPYDFNTKVTKDLTLKALWKEIKEDIEMYTIEFDSNGGSLISKQILEKGSKVIKPTDPTRKNYKFIEWTKDNKPYDFNEEITENITLIANWEKIEEKKTETKTTPDTPKPKEETKPTENNKNEYNVTFNTTGGSEVSSIVVSENNTISKPANPTKTGYIFDTWLLNSTPYDFNNPVNSNISLVATWIPINYNISYSANIEDVLGSMETTTCEYDKECTLSSNNYSKENYTFIGWSTSPNGEVLYNNNSQVLNLTSNNNDIITLYAIWKVNE